MKYYKATKNLPGHREGDILVQTNDFYMWETEPFYTFPKEIVETDKEYFEQIITEFNEGDDIWYVSMNGLIIADKFKMSKHSSLVEYGNIFKYENDAKHLNRKVKEFIKKIKA